jgi:Ca2+-binding RTX toxin-like protein
VIVDSGAGSDVIHVSGNTYSVIRAGEGDDLVTAEGESVIFGGDGNDLLNGKTVSGDDGNDIIYATSFGSGGEGDDLVVLFGLEEPQEGVEPVASGLGGAGNDTIIADVSSAVDGGTGNDVVVLRRGGLALGGLGNDTLSALTDAQIDGGAGDDDILLLQGGLALGGDGNDRITVSGYGEAAGGKGNDNVNLYAGGIYRFEAGDGADRLLISSPEGDAPPRASQVNLEGFLYSDVTITASKGFVSIASKTTGDKIDITIVDGKLPLELRFAKGADAQFVTVEGTNVRPGAILPRDRVV